MKCLYLSIGQIVIVHIFQLYTCMVVSELICSLGISHLKFHQSCIQTETQPLPLTLSKIHIEQPLHRCSEATFLISFF